MKRCTTDGNQLIERVAQERVKYENIFNDQARILRRDPAGLEMAMAQMKETSLVAKHGQHWLPTPEQVDEYLAWCDDLCQTVPETFDNHVKILHGAHAGLMCVIICKMGRQPERIQMAILKRYTELARRPEFPPQPATELPLSKPSGDPRRLTAAELRLFQSPDELHGKQFIFSPDADGAGMFEVIGYRMKRDRTIQYEVLFEDCGGEPIPVEADEMISMLRDSLYLPA